MKKSPKQSAGKSYSIRFYIEEVSAGFYIKLNSVPSGIMDTIASGHGLDISKP